MNGNKGEIAYLEHAKSMCCGICGFSTPNTTTKGVKLIMKLHYKKTHNTDYRVDTSSMVAPPREIEKQNKQNLCTNKDHIYVCAGKEVVKSFPVTDDGKANNGMGCMIDLLESLTN